MMGKIVKFIVRGTRNTAEDLWWHCRCNKHNSFYLQEFLSKSERQEYYE